MGFALNLAISHDFCRIDSLPKRLMLTWETQEAGEVFETARCFVGEREA